MKPNWWMARETSENSYEDYARHCLLPWWKESSKSCQRNQTTWFNKAVVNTVPSFDEDISTHLEIMVMRHFKLEVTNIAISPPAFKIRMSNLCAICTFLIWFLRQN